MSSARLSRGMWGVWTVVLAATAVGCSWPPGYLPSAILGELRYLGQMVPIEAALEDPALTPDQVDKLAFLLRARDYAHDVVGLNVGNNFQTFVNHGDDTLAWNLSASRKDAFEPYVWRLPIAGPLPYLGFFERDQGLAERDRLVERGYDTFMYAVDAFALPWLPDPVSSRLLDRDWGQIADVVIHELTHNTVVTMSDVTFSESLAVFVGRTASIDFIEQEFGAESPLIQETLDQREDSDRLQTFLQDLTDELNALYAGDLTSEEKIAERAAVFDAARERFANGVLPLMNNPESYEAFADFPYNNAFLLVNVRYHSDQEVFERIHEMTGRDWAQSLSLFSQAGRTADPVGFLEARLEP